MIPDPIALFDLVESKVRAEAKVQTQKAELTELTALREVEKAARVLLDQTPNNGGYVRVGGAHKLALALAALDRVKKES
jgi:hypothetical protein